VNAQISPKVSGYIVSRNYQEGYFVTKGQVLFEIYERPLRASLDQAKAAVAGAVANLGNSKLNVARDTPLAKEKAIAQSQLDNEVQTLKANQAALDAALAEQQNAELNLAWTKVRSPIDGVAGVAAAQVGDLVSNTNVLTRVSQLDPIRAYFSISESDYLSIAPRLSMIVRGESSSAELDAMAVQFIQANGLPFASQGRFVLIGREVSSATGTIQLATEFQNEGSLLRPGGFGRVRIKIGTKKDAMLIPQRAVNEVQGEYQVVVLSAAASHAAGTTGAGANYSTGGIHCADRKSIERAGRRESARYSPRYELGGAAAFTRGAGWHSLAAARASSRRARSRSVACRGQCECRRGQGGLFSADSTHRGLWRGQRQSRRFLEAIRERLVGCRPGDTAHFRGR
jgi:RND family efflux transporter MFP subunit